MIIFYLLFISHSVSFDYTLIELFHVEEQVKYYGSKNLEENMQIFEDMYCPTEEDIPKKE